MHFTYCDLSPLSMINPVNFPQPVTDGWQALKKEEIEKQKDYTVHIASTYVAT